MKTIKVNLMTNVNTFRLVIECSSEKDLRFLTTCIEKYLKDTQDLRIYIQEPFTLYISGWIMKDSHIDFVEALLQNLDLRQQNIDRLNKLVDYINNK